MSGPKMFGRVKFIRTTTHFIAGLSISISILHHTKRDMFHAHILQILTAPLPQYSFSITVETRWQSYTIILMPNLLTTPF